MLREAAKELHVEFSLAGKVDYTYVSGAAQSALVEDGPPTDLGLRTGVSLRHVLIDEFQDTSIAQYELLAALTATWEPGDGHTLFAVGDPMQSIYLFREAEVGLFLRAGERRRRRSADGVAAAHAELPLVAVAGRVDQFAVRAAVSSCG